MENEIEEITIETMGRLPAHERYNAVLRRQEWLKKVRKEDLELTLSEEKKIEYFLKKKHNMLLRPELISRQCCVVNGDAIMLCIIFSFRTGKLNELFHVQLESSRGWKIWKERKEQEKKLEQEKSSRQR